MKGKAVILVSIFCVVFAISCASFDTSYSYQNNNVRIATIPALVSGMQLIDGYAREAGSLQGSIDTLSRVYANEAARNGYSNCVVLVTLTSQGPHSSIYEVTIWK